MGLKDVNNLERTEKPRGREVNENRDKSHGNCDAFGNNTSKNSVEFLEKKDGNRRCMNGLLNEIWMRARSSSQNKKNAVGIHGAMKTVRYREGRREVIFELEKGPYPP